MLRPAATRRRRSRLEMSMSGAWTTSETHRFARRQAHRRARSGRARAAGCPGRATTSRPASSSTRRGSCQSGRSASVSEPISRKNSSRRVAAVQLGQRLGGVAGAGRSFSISSTRKAGWPASGEFEHLARAARTASARSRLVRRPRAGRNQTWSSRRLLAALLGQDQVAHVDRVERAAEDADAHGWRWSESVGFHGSLQV